LKLKAYVL